MCLKGKIALVTGASRGIGKATALELAKQGANVVVNYVRNRDKALETVKDIRDLGVDSFSIGAHLGDPQKIGDMFRSVSERFGRLDILVNNAASGVQRSALDLDAKHWDWTLDINTRAPWLCAKEAVKLMFEGGHIVNITSLGSHLVLKDYLSVGVSKAGLEALTRYLAVELAPRGISVNAVAGGLVETDALNHFDSRDDMIRASINRTPAGRMVSVYDIAKAVVFLCQEGADMIRGQVIVVDGVISLRWS